MKQKKGLDWLLRCAKGAIIGTGFILPGVSGGALAVIFGLYERIIGFLAHPMERFWKNVHYLLPVAVGMLAGIILLSYPLEFFLDRFPAQTLWCFIGCILGTAPLLWKQSGKHGRKPKHLVIAVASLVFGVAFLLLSAKFVSGQVEMNTLTWMASGVLIALGVLVPGLSPSNFLLYLGMYVPLMGAFQRFQIWNLFLVAAGGLLCLLLCSKVIDWVFRHAYATMFHFILGIVAASTLLIVPTDYNYFSLGGLLCVVLCAVGVVIGRWMSHLEETYKTDAPGAPEAAVQTQLPAEKSENPMP